VQIAGTRLCTFVDIQAHGTITGEPGQAGALEGARRVHANATRACACVQGEGGALVDIRALPAITDVANITGAQEGAIGVPTVPVATTIIPVERTLVDIITAGPNPAVPKIA
jgi:hypothetical protein